MKVKEKPFPHVLVLMMVGPGLPPEPPSAVKRGEGRSASACSPSDPVSLWAGVEGCPLDRLEETGAGPRMCV